MVLIDEVGLNINGDLAENEIIKRAVLAEKAGIKVIWIGEFELFKDPLYIAKIIAENTSLCIGFGILSPFRRDCKKIIKCIRFLTKKYDNQFLLGLAPGGFYKKVDLVMNCVKIAKKEFNVFVGCSSPKITNLASKLADGILFNYVYPAYIEWIKKYMEKDVFTAAFGPSLLLPSSFYQDLMLAAAIVMGSSRAFLKEFGLEAIWRKLSAVKFLKLIKARQSGVNLEEFPEFGLLKKHSGLLTEKFTISGGMESIVERVKSLLKVCNHVVLGDPFFRDVAAVKSLRDIVKSL
jgi:5,10-methylenetetrahydromethanopterin reductase